MGEIGRWCYRGWVRCESCEVQQRHPVGAESRADFECEHCGATLRWTDEDETPKGANAYIAIRDSVRGLVCEYLARPLPKRAKRSDLEHVRRAWAKHITGKRP